jgi:excisionase family DNA binding protein
MRQHCRLPDSWLQGQTDTTLTDEGPLPELHGSVTVGVITVTQLDWWNEHPDAFSEAEEILGREELQVDLRTLGPVIEERPAQHLTMSVEEAANALGISRTSASEAVARGEIPCIRIGPRILVPVVALNRLPEAPERQTSNRKYPQSLFTVVEYP